MPLSTKKLAVEQPSTSLTGDLLAITAISLGVILAVGGLFLVISDAMILSAASKTQATTQSLAYIIDMFPGVPFSMSWPYDLVSEGITAIGIIAWVVGIDILLVGLGLWTGHKLARWVAIAVFGLATWFDFVTFLFFGVSGAPEAVFGRHW